MGLLWVSGFVLGVSLFVPFASFQLAIDYYEVIMPGAQLAVKIIICYMAAFVAMQVLCHALDAWISRFMTRSLRVKARHAVLAALLALVILWDQLLVGADLSNVPSYASAVLLVIVTLSGIADGFALGAAFGEAAVLGPSTAHALVAGSAGVMPLLAVLRVVSKAALPSTLQGMRRSVTIYFAAAAAVILLALVVYALVIAPAVVACSEEAAALAAAATVKPGKAGAAAAGAAAGGALLSPQMSRALNTLPLVPTLKFGDSGGGSGGGSGGARRRRLHYELTLPTSVRGMPVLVSSVRADAYGPAGGGALFSREASGYDSFLHGSMMATGAGGGREASWLERWRAVAGAAAPMPTQGSVKLRGERVASGPLASVTHLAAVEEGGAGLPGAATGAVAAAPSAKEQRPHSGTGASPFQAFGAKLFTAPTARQQAPSARSAGSGSAPSGPASSAAATRTATASRAGTGALPLGSVGLAAAAAGGGAFLASSAAVPQSAGAIGRQVTLAQLRSCITAGAVGSMVHEMMRRTSERQPPQPLFFRKGVPAWRANLTALQANWRYVASVLAILLLNYGVFPAFISFVSPPQVLGSWCPLLLVIAYGVGDLAGKLTPIWGVDNPQRAVLMAAIARIVLFVPAYAVALAFNAPFYVFVVITALLSFTACFEATIFARACEGQHPVDAVQIESLLVIFFTSGAVLGSPLSLAWRAGPWADRADDVAEMERML